VSAETDNINPHARRMKEVFDFDSHPGKAVVRPEIAKQLIAACKPPAAAVQANSGKPMICDFCGGEGHEDSPCPVRHASAARYAEEGRKAYPVATGIEAMVCQGIRDRILPKFAERLCVEIASRQRLGLAKYGTALKDNPASLRERLRHALEEALDLTVYLRWISHHDDAPDLEELDGLELMMAHTAAQILNWIDEAEGEESK